MSLIKLIKSLPGRFAIKRMLAKDPAELQEIDTERFSEILLTIGRSTPDTLVAQKKEIGRLLEILPADMAIALMSAVEEKKQGLIQDISLERQGVRLCVDHMERAEFVANLFKTPRVKMCSETARRIMGL